jgi:hypothetical protein
VKTYPAQIIFTETERVDGPKRWKGRLMRPSACIDIETGRAVTWTPIFDIEERANGTCHVTMQGGSDKGGRRYATHPNVTAAQEAGVRWAGRRFRVSEEIAYPPTRHIPSDGTWGNDNRVYWAEKAAKEREEKARSERGLLNFLSMLGPIGSLR